jgi:hypothetical protein
LALNQLGLLDRVAVLSTVSGGSLIGAYFHAHQGDFASFEAKIRALLAQGLVAPMRRKLFSALGIKVAAAFIVIGMGVPRLPRPEHERRVVRAVTKSDDRRSETERFEHHVAKRPLIFVQHRAYGSYVRAFDEKLLFEQLTAFVRRENLQLPCPRRHAQHRLVLHGLDMSLCDRIVGNFRRTKYVRGVDVSPAVLPKLTTDPISRIAKSCCNRETGKSSSAE